MNTEEIKEYIINFQKKELPPLIEREIKISDSKKIKSIIGPRRAGKTYLMYQHMKYLLKSGTKKENILYLNLEDPRLIDINFKEINDILKVHWQLFPQAKKLYIFIDEPQNITNWEIAVRSLHDDGFNIFLTGSSSKLLSQEIATSLRGRSISYLLLPFSFQEFLTMKNFSSDITKLSSHEQSILGNLLNEYQEFGGFPEVISEKGKEEKMKIINEYFNLVVYKDIVDRYNIKNVKLIKWLIKSLTISYTKEFSIHKIFLTLKSQGIKLSKNTLYSYLSMLEDTSFVFLLQKFNYSIRKTELSISKVYLNDVSFTKLIEISKDLGRKMENTVFLKLLKEKIPPTELFFWKNQAQEEVDFVIKKGQSITQLIQVCHNIDDRDTKKREIRSLLKASKELKCNNLLIITQSKKGSEKVKDKNIKFIPLWKWLLDN